MALAWEDLSDVARKPDLIKQHATDRLWQMFGQLILAREHDHPFVISQLGQSLDGRIATPSGHSHYINGPDALEHLHRLRALVDAIVVGASTVALDNPSLTVRRVSGPNPARVIIDTKRRVDVKSQFFVDDGVPVVVIGPPQPSDPSHLKFIAPEDQGTCSPAWIRKQLEAMGFRRILVEGGATTVSQFIAHGMIDRLHVLTGPLIIGSGANGINLPKIDHLDHALRPQTSVFPFDSGDVLFDCDFSQHADIQT